MLPRCASSRSSGPDGASGPPSPGGGLKAEAEEVSGLPGRATPGVAPRKPESGSKLVHSGVSTLMPVSRTDPVCVAEERPSGCGEVERDRESEGEREAAPKVRIGRREEA